MRTGVTERRCDHTVEQLRDVVCVELAVMGDRGLDVDRVERSVTSENQTR